MEGPITPTCKLIGGAAVALALVAPSQARADRATPEDSARLYVQARAASLEGELQRSARLFAILADANSGDQALVRRAFAAALDAGDMELSLRLARSIGPAALSSEGRLLLVADAIRRNRAADAVGLLSANKTDGDLSFLAPLFSAWDSAQRKDLGRALETINRIPANSLLARFSDEHRALILLKFRRAAEAEPFARKAVEGAGWREHRLRLAFADGFLDAGDKARALSIVEGLGTETYRARQRVQAGKASGLAIDSLAMAFSEVLLGLAVDLNRLEDKGLPVGLAQVARYAAPRNSSASVLLGVLRDAQGRPDDALAALRQVPETDALSAQARDAQSRVLTDEKRFDEALALATAAASVRSAGVSEYARLGDVLQAAERFDESADAYGRAIVFANSRGDRGTLWPLYLLRASSLESADRWPESRQALQAALALAPDQPLVLNFLGYSKLERGEDLDGAEAMIRKASALAPDDASITDSLGWALFKRGRLPDAITVLQRAAAGDPGQAEIHEHLGDALYSAGRRYEARFAWNAALITAEEDVAGRIRSKIAAGLTPATAAP